MPVADSVTSVPYWLYKCQVQKLVVVISSIDNSEILERWQFDIESFVRDKSPKVIQEEIRSVIRQITATVTFLPLLETACKYV
ncbi:unnamed protein product [Ranitomeya imitator]|uniref:HORMA domain-containing protein n=1 Tax=Ranitomeya imitator TaxID=111125 RepID=A0ABN9L6P3_9NEOB|nr:unnamed protein product [Ranitomeya imitator]